MQQGGGATGEEQKTQLARLFAQFGVVGDVEVGFMGCAFVTLQNVRVSFSVSSPNMARADRISHGARGAGGPSQERKGRATRDDARDLRAGAEAGPRGGGGYTEGLRDSPQEGRQAGARLRGGHRPPVANLDGSCANKFGGARGEEEGR